jgi:amidophosphoribosyltransferase
VAVKDVKLRTFITEDSSREEMVSHVYDISYGTIRKDIDNLVVMDDSIVRGTTLEKSILSILDRLGPKKIVVVSSAPQIRFPDCYGIDMSKMKDFIAFRAVVALVEERGMQDLMKKTYNDCIEMEKRPRSEVKNCVNQLYEAFTEEEISAKISEIVKPKHIFSEVQVIYQSVEDLHKAIPNHTGDWYFTGNFPTPGGNRVANRAFMNYMEGKDVRAY